MQQTMTIMKFVLCISNDNYEASLLPWKVYQALPNPKDEASGLLRVIDEEEEDYLFPKDLFMPIELSE